MQIYGHDYENEYEFEFDDDDLDLDRVQATGKVPETIYLDFGEKS